ncbi:RNA polymerase sigma factor [Polluticoccus soli]|uniref:RNA polymerase sigma factor n=1 Tax=Polluticoccus soli TaxID=3034150 RepID=UPI0023E30522|nr:sigma-70 family RNA polymerase sigma factor [Flavipsychrobacter sp. JY13-12]
MYGSNTEQELLMELAAGKRSATEQVYSQHYPIVTKWIQKNGGSEPDAADIYQEAMVILFEKAQNEEFRLSCRIGTYLFAVSKNLWFKKLQKLQKDPINLPDTWDGAYEDDVKAHHERETHFGQLNEALDKIGEPCRSLLKAFYQHDKSMQEIAADFGYTNPDNAKTQKYKCLTRLRKLFYGVQAKI